MTRHGDAGLLRRRHPYAPVRSVGVDPGPPAIPTPARWALLRAFALAHPLTNLVPFAPVPEAAETRLPGGWTVLLSANN